MAETIRVKLIPSPRSQKKWRVIFEEGGSKDFGQAGASDYTLHKDKNRQESYLSRHAGNEEDGYLTSRRENWTRNGYKTAGFWSRWLTWNLPSLENSIADIQKRFDIIIDYSPMNNDTNELSKSTLPMASTNLLATSSTSNRLLTMGSAPLPTPVSPSTMK